MGSGVSQANTVCDISQLFKVWPGPISLNSAIVDTNVLRAQGRRVDSALPSLYAFHRSTHPTTHHIYRTKPIYAISSLDPLFPV